MILKVRPLHACGLLILLSAAILLILERPIAPSSPTTPAFRSTSGATTPSSRPALPKSGSRITPQRRGKDVSNLLNQLSTIADPGERAEFVSETLRRLSASDPKSLLEFATGLPSGPLRTPTILQALEASATIGDADELMHEASRLLPPEEVQAAQLSVAEGWAVSSPRDAMEWAGTLEDDELQSTAIQIISAKWGDKDPVAALAWLDTQPDLTGWSETIIAISASWANREPERALAWAKMQSASAPDCPEPLHAVLREWSLNDPESTARALSLEPVEVQRQVAHQLAENYARLDIQKAANWMEHLTDPEVRREAVTAIEKVRQDVPDPDGG